VSRGPWACGVVLHATASTVPVSNILVSGGTCGPSSDGPALPTGWPSGGNRFVSSRERRYTDLFSENSGAPGAPVHRVPGRPLDGPGPAAGRRKTATAGREFRPGGSGGCTDRQVTWTARPMAERKRVVGVGMFLGRYLLSRRRSCSTRWDVRNSWRNLCETPEPNRAYLPPHMYAQCNWTLSRENIRCLHSDSLLSLKLDPVKKKT
jgi:hypothetical protein